MSSETIIVPAGRFLIVGCGSIGKRHVRNLRRLGVVNFIAFDIREDRRQEVKQQFNVSAFSELSKALSQDVRVAFICTPTHLHLQHAIMAARADCHLFIEKPIADAMDGIDELLDEVKRRKLVTLIGCNFRFDSGLRRIKKYLDEGAIGSIVSARAQFGQYLADWHPWEDYRETYSAHHTLGGGVVLDRIHEIDYLRWLLGEITEVYAMLGRLSHLEIDVEDTAEILLRFASGAFGSVHLDYVRRTYDCRLEIVGEEGIIQWSYNQESIVRLYSAKEGTWSCLQRPNVNGNEMYLEEMRHFLRVLQGQELSEMDAAEGKEILSIALAVKKAARDRCPVTI